jgi:tyrosine-protein kinase Etk/Wzc
MGEKKNTLLIILRSAIVHRRMIIVNVFVVTVLAVIISLLLPKWYRATVVILPPEKTESLADLAITMGLQSVALGAGGFALPMMASPSDLLASIAESRTVAGRVVDSLNLVEVFGAISRESAIGTVRDRMNVHVKAEGIIEISYISKDRERAAVVANLIAAELDEINRLHNTQKARDLKMFIMEELEKNDRNLRKAEDALQEFQRKYKAISLDNQTAASIQTAAELYSQMTLDQISLKVMEKTHAPSHPEVINLKYKISEIEKQLALLQDGTTQSSDSVGAFLSIPFSDLPQLSIRYYQLARDLKKEETLHEVLSSQLEQAKIMEAKDTPTISILDEAVPPQYKFKPKRAYIVLTGMILSFFFSLILVVLLDKWQEFKTTSPGKYEDFSDLLGILKGDLLGFKGKK